MVETFQGNLIAAGHDNTDGLFNIETVKVNSRYFPAVDDLGKYSDGIGQLRGDSVEQPQGGNTSAWVFSGAMSTEQWEWAYYTLLGGNRSGKVTFRTQRYTAGFYIIANAVMNIGDPPALQKVPALGFYRPSRWTFTRLAILEEDLMYGSIYAKDASTAQTGITTTPELLTGFTANGISSGTTPAFASGSVTASYSRKHTLVWWADFGSITASKQFKFNFRVNAVEQVIQCEFTSNATPDGVSVYMDGDLSITADDIITVYVESNDGGGVDLTMLNSRLSIASLSTS